MTFPDSNGQPVLTGLQEHERGAAPLPASGKNVGELRLASRAQEEQAVREFTSGERQRAQRFAIRTPLRYRTVGDGEWRQGTMVNISETGVLFQGEPLRASSQAVEMRFKLSTGSLGEPAVQVICRGMMVRAVTEPGSAKVTAQAARVAKFRFVRPGQAPLA